MIRKLILFLTILFSGLQIYAQTDTSSHLRVSLVTCGVGDEVWETFGHAGIRIVDSTNGNDIVYNYGTFSFGPDFEIQFMRGKLLYYVSSDSWQGFLQEYVDANRRVQEQELLLGQQENRAIYNFLKTNSLPENRNYKYDFLYDNCATRLRDILPKTFGDRFKFGNALPPGHRMTFRQLTNQYLYKEHLERFGINILLGRVMDRTMSNEEIMFLPDFLRDGIGNATVDGRKVAGEPVTILEGAPMKPAGINTAFLLTSFLALLTIAGLLIKPLRPLGRFMSGLLLFVTGLLGILIIVMWLGTDHQACQQNLNILWALPTNIIIFIRPFRNKGRYALIAIVLLVLSLILHITGIQQLALLELSPLLLALLCIYGMIYRQDKLKR